MTIRVRGHIIVAVLAGSLVNGCGPQGPVEFGSLDLSGEAVTVPEITPGQRVPPEQWPNACELVTASEITSLLPQAGVGADSRRVEVVNLASGAQEGVAPAGDCTFTVRLPGAGRGDPAQIFVRIVSVGDPRIVEDSLDNPRDLLGQESGGDDRQDHESDLGPERCFTLGEPSAPFLTPVLRCRHDALQFDLSGAAAQAEIPGADDDLSRNQVFYEKVIIPLAEAVAAKIPVA
jgi:hypothetical protein